MPYIVHKRMPYIVHKKRMSYVPVHKRMSLEEDNLGSVSLVVELEEVKLIYRTRAIISRSWLEAAFEYKPYIRTEFSENPP